MPQSIFLVALAGAFLFILFIFLFLFFNRKFFIFCIFVLFFSPAVTLPPVSSRAGL